MRRPTRLTAALAAASALVLAAAGTATAGGNLPSGTLVTATSGQQYTYTTQYDYWSVVATQPTSGYAAGLSMYDASGALLSGSNYGADYTNFIAVDSNYGTRAFQTYYPQTNESSPQQYWTQAQYGTHVITIPTPTHHGTTGFADPDIGYINLNSNDIVSIGDVYLTAGQSFWAVSPDATSELFLVEADGAHPTTYVQSRIVAALRQHTQAIDNCTLYTAAVTGWHALVLIHNHQPVPTNPQQGIAYGLHAYDASQPTYCPLANFPGATP